MIGLGGIANSHFDAIATLDNVEVVAVADLLEEKRRESMERHNVSKGYASHTELLKDDNVDAVAITRWDTNSIIASPWMPVTPASTYW